MQENVKYDGAIRVATTKSRKSTDYKNKQFKWSALLNQLKTVERSGETYAEYMALPKQTQDALKDRGGYVGGYLQNGRRKNENLAFRSLITLDIDHATDAVEVWEDFQMLYGKAAAIHSTRKHCAEKPRLRLVIPLEHEIQPDQYVAVARRIAGVLGIDNFDDTTFEPARMMYFPTACKDGEYFFDYLDAEWLSPDEILGGYKDWRRIEEHPLSSRVDKQIRHEATNRQQNPLEKTGVVGAFCSAFSIHEAIETFLPDVYESCGYDRYTYLRGSTSGGAKVYDDLFLYSHHESDPTCRSLCNAFDLVRIHKFGEKDANVRDKTDITKRPSFIAMCDFAKEHKEVLRIVLDEKKRDAKNDFKGIADDEPTPDWVLEFDKNKKDEPLANEKNIRLILQNDPKLKGLFAANYFTKQVTLTRAAWKRDPANMEMSNTDWSNLHAYFGEKYGIRKRKLVEDGWRIETCNNATHPVREYLNSLQWDGVSRIDNLFIDYLGVLDSEDGYERKVSRMLLASAVSRIYNPGCKMDYITVFVGEQGLGKSSLISRLAKNADWYAALNFSEGKETLENLRGKWLVELEELAGVGKSSPEKIKSFVSRQADRYRAAYEVSSQDYKRECVFFGTTNNPHFLKGEGGDRRFHPLSGSKERRKKIWVELEDWEVDQIWAEAKVIYENGEIPKLILETEKLGESRQKDHREIDDLEESIDVFLAQPLKADWAKDPSSDFIFAVEGESKTVLRDKVTIQAIAQHLRRHEGVHGGVANKALTDRIRKIMNNKTDWKSQTIRYGAEGLVMRGWKKTQNE